MKDLRIGLGVDAHAYDFDRNLLHTLQQDKVVAALPALHGQFGEDGEIQTLLELIDLVDRRAWMVPVADRVRLVADRV